MDALGPRRNAAPVILIDAAELDDEEFTALITSAGPSLTAFPAAAILTIILVLAMLV